MVHAETIEYQFGWWGYCLLHPEAKENRNKYPDALELINGLDGGYRRSLFTGYLYASQVPLKKDFLQLWQELLDNWDSFNIQFIELFNKRWNILSEVIEREKEQTNREDLLLFETLKELRPLVPQQ